jgi:hypothetical protein
MRRVPFAPFLSLLLASTALVAQEKFTLRNEFQPGSTFWWLQTQDMSQTMQMGDKPMATAVKSQVWMEGKVAEVKDGVATIEQRYARIKAFSDSPMMKVDYDSDVPDSKPGPMRALAQLVDKTVKARVDTRGKVHDVTAPEDVEDALATVGTSLKQGFEQASVAWPEQPVAIGDTWTNEMDFPMAQMGTMKAVITNKLVAVKDKHVTVEQKIKMDTSGLKLPGNMKMEVTKSEGTMVADLRSPAPVDGTVITEMKMGGGGAGPTMNMTMNVSMKSVEKPAPKAAPADAPKTGK